MHIKGKNHIAIIQCMRDNTLDLSHSHADIVTRHYHLWNILTHFWEVSVLCHSCFFNEIYQKT